MRRALFVSVSMTCALFITGCAVKQAQSLLQQARSLPTANVTIDAIPAPPDWVKGGLTRVSPDGATVYGRYFSTHPPTQDYSENNWYPYRWSKKGGFVRLPGTARSGEDAESDRIDARIEQWKAGLSEADRNDLHNLVMSPDGSLVVGSKGSFPGNHAILWREDTGIIDLAQYIESIPTLKGWYVGIEHSVALSADGTTIVLSGEKKGQSQDGYTGFVRLSNPIGFGKNGKLPGIESDELRVSGTVKDISATKWVLAVTTVTRPDGQATTLPAARDKIIRITPETVFVSRPTVGNKATVTGHDGGVGKLLTARTIAITP